MTITHKILLSVTLILLIGLGTIGVTYQALTTVEQALYEVTDVKELTSAAAYEMEISVIGTSLGVLKYPDASDSKYRERVAKDMVDFARFKALLPLDSEHAGENPWGAGRGALSGVSYAWGGPDGSQSAAGKAL